MYRAVSLAVMQSTKETIMPRAIQRGVGPPLLLPVLCTRVYKCIVVIFVFVSLYEKELSSFCGAEEYVVLCYPRWKSTTTKGHGTFTDNKSATEVFLSVIKFPQSGIIKIPRFFKVISNACVPLKRVDDYVKCIVKSRATLFLKCFLLLPSHPFAYATCGFFYLLLRAFNNRVRTIIMVYL